MNVPSCRDNGGQHQRDDDRLRRGPYKHCVRGRQVGCSAAGPDGDERRGRQFRAWGAPFALYPLCEVSPSCLPDDLGEAGGVSFVDNFNGAGFVGAALVTVYDKGDANSDSARARVTFDCKPLPAHDSSATSRSRAASTTPSRCPDAPGLPTTPRSPATL